MGSIAPTRGDHRPNRLAAATALVLLVAGVVAGAVAENTVPLKPATPHTNASSSAPPGLSRVGRTSAAPAEVAVPPTRIVSTAPSITESLFALGLGSRVVGVSNFCNYPPEVSGLPRVGSFLRPDVELIARLHPDLVVISAGPNQAERQLASLGLRAVTVTPGNLASVYSTIKTLGDAAAFTDRADALIADIQRRLDRIRTAAAGRPVPRVLVIVSRRPGSLSDLIAVGNRSYLGELIGLAGGINVLGDEQHLEYPRISLETVVRLAPDVIVDAAEMGETLETRRRKQPETLALWQREAAAASLRQPAVHVVASDAFLVPGPRVVEVAETFARWFHEGDRR